MTSSSIALRTPRRNWWGAQPIGSLFALPYLVFVAVIFAYPLGFAVYIAFHDYFFTAPGVEVPKPFVGFDNFVTALTDPQVLESFRNTAVFLVINVPLTVVLGLVLATALDAGVRWASAYRIAFFVPYLTASVSLVGVWMLLFSSGGLVNAVLGPLAPDPSWLVNPALAMPTIALYVTWKQLGFYILLYLAALQNVPRELHESAETDGANGWQRFLNVTVPGVRATTTLVLILAIITGANLFTEPYLLTNGGGPDGASVTPVLLIYQRGIQQQNPDVAAAIGMILVIVVGLLSLIANRVNRET
ncbi:binding-protein-dependent transport systems inner membrane component [Beutenbergia cavernae DSM 12333]|uniref:Binding-protein-dependent transport systems inner membrane component n=1 Tax=Beutenbergia cavernae (strain ATCC BAA-8 / DSM 12333 / CCUG 43141 / JCM 11478 / NBRC 16432 / NCIMB 13614 / HKI 0122) TaxID=471853 RepID=C5BVD7_BEUC1|nr:sugar ABC transporter permease [Beutenbergia cavernae]ACQ80524.1 binding-protein-dependent transport systems inner membrane component [Beutenbergia cavernae DSM 12333]